VSRAAFVAAVPGLATRSVAVPSAFQRSAIIRTTLPSHKLFGTSRISDTPDVTSLCIFQSTGLTPLLGSGVFVQKGTLSARLILSRNGCCTVDCVCAFGVGHLLSPRNKASTHDRSSLRRGGVLIACKSVLLNLRYVCEFPDILERSKGVSTGMN